MLARCKLTESLALAASRSQVVSGSHIVITGRSDKHTRLVYYGLLGVHYIPVGHSILQRVIRYYFFFIS